MTFIKSYRAAARCGAAVLIIGVLVGVGLCITGGVQYYRWREGLLPGRAYHQDQPLGKFSLGGLHFGACFTDVEGGSMATFCDGFPTPPPGFGLGPNPMSSHVWLGPKQGNAITLCFVRRGNDAVLIVPLP